MALLWPRKLPRSILDDPRRRAEISVYNRFAEALDDSFHVFYSSPWLGTDRLGNEKDGECDFLVAHPRHGLLAIEVKGGEISYDPKVMQWRSKDSFGFVHKIKDPVGQARSAKHELLKKLNAAKHWRWRRIHAVHGVIFPNVGSPPGDLGADRPLELFCCSSQLKNGFRGWVAARLNEGSSPENCKPLGNDGIEALEKLLAFPFTLSFRIGAAVAETDMEFRVLEPTQYQVLDTISEIPRALVRGGAGTGKTVLAIEEAVRSASAGNKTLLTCHSRPLAKCLKWQLKDIQNLTIAGFHEFCGQMAQETQVEIPARSDEQELYEKTLPNALFYAMEVNHLLKFDTIIVDEGQDFLAEWWIAIDACLLEKGQLRVFMDSNQKIYESASGIVHDLSLVHVRLASNLRNTKKIHDVASVHYSGPEITAVGPDGMDVSWIVADSSVEKVKAACKEIRRLLFHEELAPSDLAVLVNNKETKGQIRDKVNKLGVPIIDAEFLSSAGLVIDTVRRFKGLERSAVIVVASEDDISGPELPYVAFTRARAFLCVIATTGEQRRFGSKLPD